MCNEWGFVLNDRYIGSLQAQRRRTVLEQRHRRGLGQGNGWYAHNHRKVRKSDWQQRCRFEIALFGRGRQQPIHHDGGTGFLVRFIDHCTTVQPATLAVHHVLPHAPQVSWCVHNNNTMHTTHIVLILWRFIATHRYF